MGFGQRQPVAKTQAITYLAVVEDDEFGNTAEPSAAE